MNFDVCLIAKNEEKTLPKLLDSLAEFHTKGGEIYLLDTGSTDNTVEVARKAGCNVVEVGDKFIREVTKEQEEKVEARFNISFETGKIIKAGQTYFDYSSARNYAASLGDKEVVAMPDCDEEFTSFDLNKINEIIHDGADRLKYNFVFSHDENGNALKKFQHSKFYNKNKLGWNGIIHEVLQPIKKDQDIKEVFCNEDVIKLEHWQNEERSRKHYLTGLAVDRLENPKNDRHAHYFARDLMYHGFYYAAMENFRDHIKMNGWLPEQSQSMIYIGDCMKYIGSPKSEQRKKYHEAFEMYEHRREPLMKLAESHLEDDNYQQAACYAEAALTVPSENSNYYSNYQPYYEEAPHEILYYCYYYLGREKEAYHHYQVAKSYKPKKESIINDAKFFQS